MNRIALAGVKHSGKSTKGRLLAQANNGEFLDLDDLITALLPSGYTIRSWYREKGQESFMKMETLALEEYLEGDPERFSCLALGGATLENPEARTLLKDSSLCLCGLEDSEEILFQRILKNGLPPFLDTNDPQKTFHELYEKRSNTIRQFSDIVVSTLGLSLQDAVDKLDREIHDFLDRNRKTGA